jgi:hypothetical protein
MSINKILINHKEKGMRDTPLWDRPNGASARNTVSTTTRTVFPGAHLGPGEPESRTPESLCLSMRDAGGHNARG